VADGVFCAGCATDLSGDRFAGTVEYDVPRSINYLCDHCHCYLEGDDDD
jgi:hypothetical protein